MSLFDLSRFRPMSFSGVVCHQCGRRTVRTDVADGWCKRCRGEVGPARQPAKAIEILPADWCVVGSTWPGMSNLHEQGWTFPEAVKVAGRFGGRVRPIAERKSA